MLDWRFSMFKDSFDVGLSPNDSDLFFHVLGCLIKLRITA